MLTVEGITDFVRAETGELDSKRITDTQILRYINYGQLKVQNGFAMINFKAFTKIAYYEGAYIQEPTDLLKYPNAVIDLLTGTGAKATTGAMAVGNTNGTITNTAKNFGTEWNGWGFGFTDDGSHALTITFDWLNKTILVNHNGAVTTIAQVITFLNADTTYSAFWTATGTNTTDVTANRTVTGTSASGTGASWYPSDEVSIEEHNRIQFNTYKIPSATEPKFVRLNGFIEIKPITIQYVKLEYYYRLADLTTTTDTLAVPAEIEELVLLDVQRRIYEKTENTLKTKEMELSYNEKFKQFTEGYYNKRQSETAEKQRLQASDSTN